MVVTMVWMESWTVMIISVCILSTIAVILLCCICWESKKKLPHRFYILDDNGLREVDATEIADNSHLAVGRNSQRNKNLFRYLPTSDSFRKGLSSKALASSATHMYNSDHDLIESMEIGDSLDSALLRLHQNDSNNLVAIGCNPERDDEDDVKSCVSDGSKHTFYSVFPNQTSTGSTVRSALSHPDVNMVE